MINHVISSILRGKWAIDPLFAESYIPIIQSVLEGKTAFEKMNFKPIGYAHYEESGSLQIDFNSVDETGNIQKNSVGVISIIGPLMKYNQDCGPIGMAQISDIVKSMDSNTNILGIVLKIDSPGGTVDGTQQLAESIKNAKKPIVAFVDDTMASAALWIGSSAKEVYAGKSNDEIGSIGVMMSFLDLIPYYEALGAKWHSFVAHQSEDKNKLFDLVRKGEYEEYKKQILDPIAEDFINAMKANRPGIREDQLTGKMFFARDLVGSLIDGIKSFDETVKRIMELSQEQKKNLTNANKNSSMKKLSNLNKIVGAELESADGGIFLTEEQAEKVESGLAVNEQTANDLKVVQTERDAAITDRDKTKTDLDAVNALITEKETELAELRKKPGASTAAAPAHGELDAEGNVPIVSFNQSLEERMAIIAEKRKARG